MPVTCRCTPATSGSTACRGGCGCAAASTTCSLDAGEAAEFDTRVPHALDNPAPSTVELLSLVGPDGERVHVRARPSR